MLTDTFISYAIIIFYLGERGIELLVNKMNYRYLIAKYNVVKKFPLESMQMKLFHFCWFLTLFFEMNLHGKLLRGFSFGITAFILILAQLLRWTSILSLGNFWSIDIYEMNEHPVITNGPYSFLRHPIYITLMIEFFFLPLLLGCPYTLVAGCIGNTIILHRRIRLEEEALAEQSGSYRHDFGLRNS
jgi:methyltransferase